MNRSATAVRVSAGIAVLGLSSYLWWKLRSRHKQGVAKLHTLRSTAANLPAGEVCHTSEEGYKYQVWPLTPRHEFAVGDEVFVLLHSNKSTGRGVVTCGLISDEKHIYKGRVAVTFHENGSQAHVRPARLLPVTMRHRSVIVCPDTKTFRHLVRAHTEPTDFVVEVGSSWGVSTSIISEMCRMVIGVDCSEEGINHSRAAYPHIQFEQLDVLQNKQRLQELAAGCDKMYIDLGGDRSLDVLAMLLPFVERIIGPVLIVVKSEELHAHALKHGRSFDGPDFAQCAMQVLPQSRVWRHSLETEALANIRLSTGARTEFTQHPMKFPPKHTPERLLICRYHNYAYCKKGSACEYDHNHCNICLASGHAAQSCGVSFYFGRGGAH